MELVNDIYRQKTETGKQKPEIIDAVKTVVLLLTPFTPHICEEMWQMLGNKTGVSKTSWPKFEERLLKAEIISIVIQVNGKLRSKIEVDAEMEDENIRELAINDEKIKAWIKDKNVRQVIVVKGKLVNIVCA
jgi:leucyl-tRNA synthetase